MPSIKLHVNGQIYTGWKEVTVTRSIEQAAPTFSIGLSANFSQNTRVLPVAPGDACKLVLEGETVITGFVDGVQGGYGKDSHKYTITGRSAVGDLIDCTAIVKGGEFKNQTVEAIAKALCKPFDVPVTIEADIGKPLPSLRTDDASVHEVIERACRRRGLLLFSSAIGGLIIGAVGDRKISTPLIAGDNIKSATGKFAQNDRFSEYRVKGQADDGGAGWELEQQVQAIGIAKDPSVKRYRPLVIDAEEGETDLSKRAQFEATTRLGRSTQITYTAQGWQHNNGLWEPNTLVKVKDSYFGIDAWLLIGGVVYRHGKDGTHADITVMPKDAFSIRTLKEKAQSSSSTDQWGDVFGESANT